jgi:outer membrane protein OmpA-like peptidoglycan-associated protein
MIATCALLVGSACAHDGQRERASASAVTNSTVNPHEAPEHKRMHYTEVDDQHALGRDKDVYTTLQEGNGMPRAESAPMPQGCGEAVYFATDSSALDQGSQQRLDQLADCMKRREVDHATIVGSSDPRGKKEHNDELALERARVVAEYLRGRGVPEDQIKVRGKGAVASADRDLWPAERAAQVQTTR